jgi:hypothetical protein
MTLAVLLTIEEANRRYGATLLVALLVAGFLMWWAHRPVKVRTPREAGPGLLAGLGALLADNLAARYQARGAPSRPPRGRPGRRTWRQQAPGRALPGGGPLLAMPAPARPLSEEYKAYIGGRLDGLTGDWGGWRWPAKRRTIMGWWRERVGDRCQLGLVCGGTAKATQLDHVDYSEFRRETPRTCAPVCAPCHQRRTALARQGIDAWAWRVRSGR